MAVHSPSMILASPGAPVETRDGVDVMTVEDLLSHSDVSTRNGDRTVTVVPRKVKIAV